MDHWKLCRYKGWKSPNSFFMVEMILYRNYINGDNYSGFTAAPILLFKHVYTVLISDDTMFCNWRSFETNGVYVYMPFSRMWWEIWRLHKDTFWWYDAVHACILLALILFLSTSEVHSIILLQHSLMNSLHSSLPIGEFSFTEYTGLNQKLFIKQILIDPDDF